MSEFEVITAAQSGDPVAFQRLHDHYRPEVLHQCKRMLRSDGDAEDITQEIFLLVWQKLKFFKHESSFQTWLFRLTANRVVSHIRSRRVRPTPDGEIPENGQHADQHARLEIQEAFDNMTEMKRLCVVAEMNGNTLRYHGGANYLRSAARELREVLA